MDRNQREGKIQVRQRIKPLCRHYMLMCSSVLYLELGLDLDPKLGLELDPKLCQDQITKEHKFTTNSIPRAHEIDPVRSHEDSMSLQREECMEASLREYGRVFQMLPD